MDEDGARGSDFFFDCCPVDDLLMCGRCQSQFREVKDFVEHKRELCVASDTHQRMRLPVLAPPEQPTFHGGEFYTHELNSNFYEASTNINYLYNDGNTPKNNINGSYVSFVDDVKYDQMSFIQNRSGHQMDFSHDLNEDCINKNNYFNDVTITEQKSAIFDDVSNNEINYQIYPMTAQVFNVGDEGFIDQCNGNIMKAPMNNVDFGYPSIISHNGNYLNNVDVGSTSNCLYNYDSNNKMMLTSAKNGIEIVDIDNNNYSNGFTNVVNNQAHTIFTIPSFKAELMDDPMNILHTSSNIDVPKLSDKSVFKGKDYNVDDKVPTENMCEMIIVEQQNNINKVTKRYECDYCLKVFFRYSNLEQHLRLHTGEKPFQCPICGRKFSQKSNAKKHIKSHKVWINGEDLSLPKFHTIGVQLKNKRHLIVRPSKSVSPIINRKQFHLLTNTKNRSMFGVSNDNNNPVILVNNSFECSFCKHKFQSYQKLRSHSVVHKDLQVYLCVFADCKQTYEDLDQFLQHLEAHKKEENIKFNCQFCCTLFTTLYELMCHYKEHNTNNGNLSSKCQKEIHSNQFNSKIKIGKNINSYLCYHCNTTFKSQKSFKTHMMNFELRKHFTCPICSKGFSAEIYLSRHVKTLHKSSTILFKCKQCDKVFRTMSSLKYHRSSQHKLLPHPECKVNHCEHKKNFALANDCHNVDINHKQSKKRKVNVIDTSTIALPDFQMDTQLKQNFEEDGMICFYCGKLYRRRLPFESHVLMCKQKEIEKQRRESYKSQRFVDLKPKLLVNNTIIESDKTARRSKFTKTWTVKCTRKKSNLKCDLIPAENFVTEVKQTLPSISILNKSYDLPIESNLNSYDNESFSFLKSLEFNS